MNKQTFGALVWGDNRCLNDNTDYGKMLIFGHWHNDGPIIGYRRIGIARKNDVAVLDLSNMVITDSKGNTRQLG